MKYYEFREECEKRGLNLGAILSNNKALFTLFVEGEDEDDDTNNEIIETLDREKRRWINEVQN